MPIQCESSNDTPTPGDWDYRGGGSEPGRRFSFAVFQWKLSKDGQRLVPGNEYRRFSYGPRTEGPAQARAQSLCQELDALGHLSGCSDTQVRIKFSSDTSINAEDLFLLRRDVHPKVRINVAMHRNATPDILEELSHDAEDDVRAAVAWNRNTPDGLVRELSLDSIGTVSSAAGRSLEARRQLGSLTDGAQMVH